MRYLVFIFLQIVPLICYSQSDEYHVNSFMDEGLKAANAHHLGDAWLNFLVKADENLDYNITQATFSANAILDWHKHKTPQTLIILEGEGFYQERGKEPIVLKKGDVITCEKETEHWHTSTPDSKVSYLAIYGSEPTIWTEKLTQSYYDSVAQKLKNN